MSRNVSLELGNPFHDKLGRWAKKAESSSKEIGKKLLHTLDQRVSNEFGVAPPSYFTTHIQVAAKKIKSHVKKIGLKHYHIKYFSKTAILKLFGKKK